MPQSMSPPLSGGNEPYPPSSGTSTYGGSGYQLSPGSPHHVTTLHQPAPSNNFEAATSVAPTFSAIDYGDSRYGPHLYLETHGLPGAQVPAVDGPAASSRRQEASEWMSSASDSTYSTPSDHSQHESIWPAMDTTTNSDWQEGSFIPTYPLRDLHGPSGRLNAIPTSAAPVSFPYSTSPPFDASHVYTSMVEMPLSQYTDDHALLDPHLQRFSSLVGSPTLPLASASAECFDILVSPSTALPSHRTMNFLACLGRQKEVAVGLLAARNPMSSSLPLPPASAHEVIPGYLGVYWDRFRHLLPILHRQSLGRAVQMTDVRRCAMVAVVTQVPRRQGASHQSQPAARVCLATVKKSKSDETLFKGTANLLDR